MDTDDGPFYCLACPHCGKDAICSLLEMITRLRDGGMLRRAAKPETALVVELFTSSAAVFNCEGCGHAGLTVQPADIDDDWGEGPKCEVCGCAIPAERLQVFPGTRRCVPCQASGAQPDVREAADFCTYCGGLMTMRQSGASGITRYKMVCSDCGR